MNYKKQSWDKKEIIKQSVGLFKKRGIFEGPISKKLLKGNVPSKTTFHEDSTFSPDSPENEQSTELQTQTLESL